AQVVAPQDCPEAMPTAEVAKGMTGTGFTVSEGTEPEPFAVEVLGVLHDGVAPGRDMIVVETSSPAIEDAGGIWFGMSGSPVYADDGRLLGAVAFGLSGGPSRIGGLTTAEDLMDLLDYPSGLGLSARKKVALSGRLAQTVDARSDVASDELSLKRLRTPLSVSGVEQRGLELLQRAIKREGNAYRVTRGSSSEAAEPGASLATIGAGDTFGGALSYGDVTMGAIGTTTLVCDDKAVAFGHPFTFQGRTELGANAGFTHTIVPDPLFGAYKLADITEPVGTIDQDRLAGIRSLLGVTPETRPLTSHIEAPDIGRISDGASEAVTDDVVPTLGFNHLLGSLDSTFDEIGEGSSEIHWTVTGLTEDGDPWSLSRSNLYSNEFDISFGSTFEFYGQLITLLENKFTEIDFGNVEIDATITDEPSGYRISKVLHSTTNRNFTSGRRIRVRPGGTLFLRVTLRPVETGSPRTVNLRFDIPRRFRGGFIELIGGAGLGGGDLFCFEEFGPCSSPAGGKIDSFDELVDSLENAPRGNELIASLRGRRGRLQRQRSVELDGVVGGFRFLVLRVRGG
ncbi:MAG: hypothetical protein M3124_05580, partial [Actinomycetota bacterium]|nr:hypothetical protein [Actinomycetota bacterium]